MPVFKHDNWFSINEGLISRHTDHLRDQTFEILEIGCFEGRSTLWFLNRFPLTRITCVDQFKSDEDLKEVDFQIVKKNFMRNSAGKDVRLCDMSSRDFFMANPLDLFTLCYVDGSHRADNTLRDLIGCYDRMRDGGILIADDYMWAANPDDPHLHPKLAIDSFLACFKGKVELLEIEYGVAMRKIA